jgi:hypothetical protein
MLKLSVKALGSVSSRGPAPMETPALAITMSMWEIPAAWMVSTAFLGSSTFVFSMPTKKRRELCAVGSDLRSRDLRAWGSRTVPMTVWFGMER